MFLHLTSLKVGNDKIKLWGIDTLASPNLERSIQVFSSLIPRRLKAHVVPFRTRQAACIVRHEPIGQHGATHQNSGPLLPRLLVLIIDLMYMFHVYIWLYINTCIYIYIGMIMFLCLTLVLSGSVNLDVFRTFFCCHILKRTLWTWWVELGLQSLPVVLRITCILAFSTVDPFPELNSSYPPA